MTSIKGGNKGEDGVPREVCGIGRVETVQVGENGAGLDLEKRYSVAITDFMASGGDGYTGFKRKPVVDTGLPLRELLIDTVRRKKVISAVVEKRVLRD